MVLAENTQLLLKKEDLSQLFRGKLTLRPRSQGPSALLLCANSKKASGDIAHEALRISLPC